MMFNIFQKYSSMVNFGGIFGDFLATTIIIPLELTLAKYFVNLVTTIVNILPKTTLVEFFCDSNSCYNNMLLESILAIQ